MNAKKKFQEVLEGKNIFPSYTLKSILYLAMWPVRLPDLTTLNIRYYRVLVTFFIFYFSFKVYNMLSYIRKVLWRTVVSEWQRSIVPVWKTDHTIQAEDEDVNRGGGSFTEDILKILFAIKEKCVSIFYNINTFNKLIYLN